MELKEFIEETLTQIIEGVQSAQDKALEKDAIVSPSIIDFALDKRATKYKGVKRAVTDVHFEVALTSSEGKEGKVGIGVFLGSFSFGGQEKADAKSASVTSIRFSVPISLPITKTETTTYQGSI